MARAERTMTGLGRVMVGGVLVVASLLFVVRGPAGPSPIGFAGELPVRDLIQLHENFDLAVVGRVIAVGEPRWNSSSGRHWDDSESEFTSALVYTPVTFEVDEVVWDSGRSSTAVEPAGQLEVWFLGDPSVRSPERRSRLDGLEEGDEWLVFVFEAPLPYEDGYTDPVLRSEMPMATWGVSDANVWPGEQWQASQLRALVDVGIVPTWTPDPAGDDVTMTLVDRDHVASLLTRLDEGDAHALAILQSAARSVDARASTDEGSTTAAERTAAIEASVVEPIRRAVEVASADIDLDANGIAPPVVTIVVTNPDDLDIEELHRHLDGLTPSQRVHLIITSDERGPLLERTLGS